MLNVLGGGRIKKSKDVVKNQTTVGISEKDQRTNILISDKSVLNILPNTYKIITIPKNPIKKERSRILKLIVRRNGFLSPDLIRETKAK